MPTRDRPKSRSRKARIRPHLVHDNGEIMLELLRARAAEEERRRFVEGLPRLRGYGVGGG